MRLQIQGHGGRKWQSKVDADATISEKMFRNIDLLLLGSVIALITIGIVLIGSATHANIPGAHRYSFVLRQTVFAAINFCWEPFYCGLIIVS